MKNSSIGEIFKNIPGLNHHPNDSIFIDEEDFNGVKASEEIKYQIKYIYNWEEVNYYWWN
jgi:hypothetical protein